MKIFRTNVIKFVRILFVLSVYCLVLSGGQNLSCLSQTQIPASAIFRFEFAQKLFTANYFFLMSERPEVERDAVCAIYFEIAHLRTYFNIEKIVAIIRLCSAAK